MPPREVLRMLSLVWQRDARYLKRKDDRSSPFLACMVREREGGREEREERARMRLLLNFTKERVKSDETVMKQG